MRVALLCMSIEPGHDGVGDYVHRFARVLSARGHACQILALADRFADHPSVTLDTHGGYEIVRIPAEQWRQADIGLAIERLQAFTPDWVSLQMVCYGFEKHGLLWRSARQFASLRGASKRHMMFHELWIGAGATSPPRDRILGWLQRKLLLRATRMWSPRIVHTSNTFYREMLRGADITAEELAVPGNIPVRALDSAGARQMILQRLGSLPRQPLEPLLAGLFGSLHPEWSDGAWLDRVAALCARLGRRLVIVQLGRLGPAGTRALASLRRRASDRADFLEFGERDAAEISAIFQGLDFGVATTPWPLIGKSGTAAAMLEHGLPVLVPSDGERLRDSPMPPATDHPQLFRLHEFCRMLERNALARFDLEPRPDIFATFIGALERAS